MAINDNYHILFQKLRELGEYARKMQKNVKRNFKEDGSVLTEVDLFISHQVIECVKSLFPQANIISEEEMTDFDRNAELTFVLDPIDGTDMYSQGLASWAISLGILNKERKSVGAFIIAPRYGIGEEKMELSLIPGDRLYINGAEVFKKKKNENLSQIMFTSHDIRKYDFSSFDGKIRTIGSSILHNLFPAILEEIAASVTQACYCWDIASSHAVLNYFGYSLVYYDRSRVEYTDEFLIEMKKAKMPFIAAEESMVDIVIRQIKYLG